MTGSKKNLACIPCKIKQSFLDPEHSQISKHRQAELLGISRSFLYSVGDKKTQKYLRDEELMGEIDMLYTTYPFYGARRICQELKKQGYNKTTRYKVGELMKIMGIQAIYPKKKTSIPNKQHEIYPYLLRGVEIRKVHQVWSTDITYIKLRNGWAYLSAVIDWYSRKIISWKLSNTMDIELCKADLHHALQYGTPEIFNTDQGSQYTSSQYTNILKEKEIQISMDGVKRCLDNIYIERFWRSLKYEDIYIQKYETMQEAHKGIHKYIEFYNEKRGHQSLDYATPLEVYNNGLKHIKNNTCL